MRTLETKVWSAKDIYEAWEIKASVKDSSVFIMGGTFLQTKWENGVQYPDHLIHLGEIKEYKQIYSLQEHQVKTIHIGAFVSLAECHKHPLIQNDCSLLADSIGTIAAPAVRNLGTIGGNIANRIGDSIPALLVLDAEVLYFDGNEIKRDSLENWLKQKEDSLLLEIIITEQKASVQSHQFANKVGRREAFTASVVTIAGRFSIEENGVSLILAAGGGETIPRRLRRTENLVNHQDIETIPLQQITGELIKEYNPIADAFFAEDYRRKVAANLFMVEWEKWREKHG
ncbi:FAD binding domain-containing protein [Mesobacillus maritimus]|uniref:FAD binding domain-containing protein n=1 Tax=Mesobacillus maritimus TaxID=1643336 RepID=A0ABS7K0K8_9BACI|nr:FAD binding domain-containing protein [Mesobacillus maritimus]MBY0095753.1 FAD binding domain-containing protein [Mesobacillus maritimus]